MILLVAVWIVVVSSGQMGLANVMWAVVLVLKNVLMWCLVKLMSWLIIIRSLGWICFFIELVVLIDKIVVVFVFFSVQMFVW